MQPDSRTLLVSIRPRFAELLLDGTKTVELRRTRPQTPPGTPVLLYASSPVMQLVGEATVERVDHGNPEDVWRQHGSSTGLVRTEYDHYFTGSPIAVAIVLKDVRALRQPRTLAECRRRITSFRPPQSFRYLDGSQRALLAPA